MLPAVAVKFSVDVELTEANEILPEEAVTFMVLPPVFRNEFVTEILPAAVMVAVPEEIVAAVILPADAVRLSVELEVMVPAVMLPALLVTAIVAFKDPLFAAPTATAVTAPAVTVAVPIWEFPPPPDKMTVGAEV